MSELVETRPHTRLMSSHLRLGRALTRSNFTILVNFASSKVKKNSDAQTYLQTDWPSHKINEQDISIHD